VINNAPRELSGKNRESRISRLADLEAQGTGQFFVAPTLTRKSIKDIAKAEGVTDRYVRMIMERAFLSPDIQQMILVGGNLRT